MMNEIDDNFEEYEVAEIRRGADFSELTADDFKSIERDDDGNVFGVNNGVPFPLSTEIRQVVDNGVSYDVERRQDGSEWFLGRTGEKKLGVSISLGNVQGEQPGMQPTGDAEGSAPAEGGIFRDIRRGLAQGAFEAGKAFNEALPMLGGPVDLVNEGVGYVGDVFGLDLRSDYPLGGSEMIRDGVEAVVDFADFIMPDALQKADIEFRSEKASVPLLQEIVSGITKFGVQSVTPAMYLRAFSAAGPFARGLAWGGVADFINAQPDDATAISSLTEFLSGAKPEERSAVANAVIDVFAAQKEDPKFINRARVALDGMVIGGGIEKTIEGVKYLVRASKQVPWDRFQESIAQAGARADERLASMARGTTLSANPIGAAGDFAVSTAARLVDLLRGSARDANLETQIENVRALPTASAANESKRGTYQSYLTVDSPLENPTGGIPKKINPRNAERVIRALDENHARHPDPLASPENFARYWSDALGTDFSIIPPYQAIKYVNDPDLLYQVMSRMSPSQIRLASDGFKIADEIAQKYAAEAASVEDTAELFLWGILSRMKSAFPHESAFIDAVTHADGNGKTFRAFVSDFVAGRGDVDDFLRWAGEVYPKASPGRAASENLNAFAKTFLPKMTTPMADGRMPLQVLHDAISDRNMTGRQIRREFYKVAEGVGIDNKVLSFILLLTGRNDVMVFDRIQFNHLFNDGRFGDFNVYQGMTLPKADSQGNPVMKASGAPDLVMAPGSSIQEAGSSAQGLVLYEAVEDALTRVLPDVYAKLGRPFRGMGQFHWESWVLTSGQEVGHGSLSYFPARMSGAATPTAGARAIEGRYHKYQYGAQYGRNAAGEAIVDFKLPNGTTVQFTPETFNQFANTLNKPGEGVIPSGFNISQFENATEAWVNDPRVNQEAIIRIADDFVKSGRASVDATAGNAAGTGYSAGREAVRGFRRRIAIRSHTGDIGEASGPYEARVGRDDGGNELLTFNAKTGKAVTGLKSEVALPAIKQVGADAAQKYFDDMTAAMSDHKFGAQVEIKSVDDLASLKLFRTEGGGGFALKPDGDIVAVFGNKSEPRSGYAVLSAAVQAGGKKLDAFDTFLPDIYSAAGFKIVGRMKFNDEFAPAPPEAIRAWDKKTFKKFNKGEPDIVFMVHDPDYFGPPTGGRYFDDYDAAVAAQDAEVARIYPPKED